VEIPEFSEYLFASVEQFAHMAPVHTDEGDVTVVTGLGGGPERLRQEFG